jgi:regulation of enolase protein 1 (concanavalin A-like superfamily)
VACQIAGNFAFTARVASAQNVNQWTKAGLMIRGSLGTGARHVSLFATPTSVKGVAFQRRLIANGITVSTPGPAKAPPVWLKLTRTANEISAYAREVITGPWVLIGRETIALPYVVRVGFAVSSHVDGTLATATFDRVTLDRFPPLNAVGDIVPSGIPSPPSGSTTGDGVNIALNGSGADIWGTADAFHFNFASWPGDGTITARVRTIENTNVWAKAGVMFRDMTHGADAQHVMVIVSPGKGIAMQYRSTVGGASANAALRPGTAPEWVRLTRKGNTFTGYSSDDGLTWTTLGSVSITMRFQLGVGLAVTSHDASTLATATFDDVSVRP